MLAHIHAQTSQGQHIWGLGSRQLGLGSPPSPPPQAPAFPHPTPGPSLPPSPPPPGTQNTQKHTFPARDMSPKSQKVNLGRYIHACGTPIYREKLKIRIRKWVPPVGATVSAGGGWYFLILLSSNSSPYTPNTTPPHPTPREGWGGEGIWCIWGRIRTEQNEKLRGYQPRSLHLLFLVWGISPGVCTFSSWYGVSALEILEI